MNLGKAFSNNPIQSSITIQMPKSPQNISNNKVNMNTPRTLTNLQLSPGITSAVPSSTTNNKTSEQVTAKNSSLDPINKQKSNHISSTLHSPVHKRPITWKKTITADITSTVKKKCINPIQSKATNKVDQNHTRISQKKNELQISEKPKLINVQVSPGIKVTPMKAVTVPQATPFTSAITCTVFNEPVSSNKDTFVVCPHCKNPSQSLTRCDTCTKSIPPNTCVYHQVKSVEETVFQPILMKKLNGSNRVIYSKNVQLQNDSQSEHQQFKQSVQNKMVILRSPRSVAQTKPKPKPRVRYKYQEPVCLTISSDEEESTPESVAAAPESSTNLPITKNPDDNKSLSHLSENPDQSSQATSRVSDSCESLTPEDTEMDCNDEYDIDSCGMDEEMEVDLENSDELKETEQEEIAFIKDQEIHEVQSEPVKVCHSLLCHSIRIGSYKIRPKANGDSIPIYFDSESFRFQVPAVDEPSKMVDIHLRSVDIIETFVHFGRSLPIMFVGTTPKFAEKLRILLGMTYMSLQYFDPTSKEDMRKRITFLIHSFKEDICDFLRTHFPGEKLMEIDQIAANEILVRSTPNQNQLIKCQPVVVVQAQIADSQVQVALPIAIQQQGAVKSPQPAAPVVKILTYPPPPQTGGIAITSEDMACLNEGEFLNDAIIDFYLKYVFYEKLSEYFRERTHIFSSYFYPRLTQKPKPGSRSKPGDDRPKTIQVKRHAQVKTWTRHVDIFSKDYIIIPINQNMHWFLAIICFPGRVPEAPSLPLNQEDSKTVNKTVDSTDNQLASKPDVDSQKIEEGSRQSQVENDKDSSDSVPMKASNNQESKPEMSDSNTNPNGTPCRREAPCICFFDSLSGPNRTRITITLREYLDMEWKIKKGTKRVFDRNTMQGFVLQCPQQTNCSDCGLYLLQYVESFFEKPLAHFGSPMPDLSTWFTESCVSSKREQLKALILNLQKRQTTGKPPSGTSATTRVNT